MPPVECQLARPEDARRQSGGDRTRLRSSVAELRRQRHQNDEHQRSTDHHHHEHFGIVTEAGGCDQQSRRHIALREQMRRSSLSERFEGRIHSSIHEAIED